MKAKHTPGPWKVSGPYKTSSFSDGFIVETSDGTIVAKCEYPRDDTEARDAAKNDAETIVAVPELAEALRDIIGDLGDLMRGAESKAGRAQAKAAHAQARAALKKAGVLE